MDYYPFGMLVPHRHGAVEDDDYRYGFNGKEKDDEMKGEGNSYDYGGRMLDPRVGRWFTTDKMEGKYPSVSPYNAFLNNPIFFVDPDGNDIEPWKWYRYIFTPSYYWGPYYSFENYYESDVKFDKAYHEMKGSSKIFKAIISQLQNSSRTYKFDQVYNDASYNGEKHPGEGGHFDPNAKGTKEDPFTINFVVDFDKKVTYMGDKGVIFEETFHAAQNDLTLTDSKLPARSKLAIEVEAKIAKNIEGFTSGDPGFSYEVMEFKGDKEIFSALRSGKKLTESQRKVLGTAIQSLAERVSDVYSKIGTQPNPEYSIDKFYAPFDLDFIEKLYGQPLVEKEEVIIIVPKKTKK